VGIIAVPHGRIRGACSAVLVVAAVMAAFGLEAAPASAEDYDSWSYDDLPLSERAHEWKRRPRSEAFRARKAHIPFGPRLEGAPSAREAEHRDVNKLERPLFVVVSIADQRVSVYNHHGLVESSAISTGMAGHPTPTGLFTIIGRERYHASNIYSGAPMPFMQRITWSGIAMHLGVVPGHPASHGCIRLPAGFAVKLWGLTRIGERVVISPQDVTPDAFAHSLLPAPKMRAPTEADTTAPSSGPPPPAATAAKPPLVNPHQYAEQLKAKATAEAAAARKIAKEAAAASSLKQQEAARAAAELEAGEAAYASAQVRADAAAKADEAAAAAAGARRQESVAAAAEFKAAEADASLKIKAERLAKAYAQAMIAQDAAATAQTSAVAALADAAAKLETVKKASSARAEELADAARRSNEAAAAADAAANAEKEAQRRIQPISVLISKKDRRIYVRQGLAPVFDAPAGVLDPEAPLGSHLYIATGVKEDGTSLDWSVMSMPVQLAEEPSGRNWKTATVDERIEAPRRLRAFPSSPAEALERVEIAPEVRDRIAERLWAGGSLIITDQPLSGETGNIGTDLTVKVR
jgi:lipoprotein-anchoring transpeptidase ErfK/SrfK